MNSSNKQRTRNTRNPHETTRLWVEDLSGLVSPPDVCIRIFDLIDTPDISSKELGEIISQDPNLTAQLLRIVNSPTFYTGNKVETISRAVTIIGVHELYSLIIAVSAVKTFSSIPKNLINIDTFWRHSVHTALTARILAEHCSVLHPERLFIAGLLHDIGNMIMYHRIPDLAKDLLIKADGNEDLLFQYEQETLGFTHADLGAQLLEYWNIPQSLVRAVRYHHNPSNAEDPSFEAAIVHIANALSNRSELGNFTEEPSLEAEIDEQAWRILGINPEELDLDRLHSETTHRFAATASLFIS